MPRPESYPRARTGRTTPETAARRVAWVLAGLLCAGLALAGPAGAEPGAGTEHEGPPPRTAPGLAAPAVGSSTATAAGRGTVATTGFHAARSVRDDSPLGVEIESITPSYLPERGPLRIAGTVTNQSDETYTAINLHVFIGDTPITSVAELAVERERDPADFVGERITVPGTFDNVPELAPGQSARYSMELSRSELGVSEPGVYWFGVHALGDSTAGRDLSGRARTFLSVVPDDTAQVPTALVIPVRRDIQHTEDGSIADVDAWAETLEDGGALRSLVEFGISAGSESVTWLVDPAIVDTVTALTQGNLPRSLDDTPPATEDDGSGDGGGGSDPPSPSGPSPTDDPTEEPEVTPNAATGPGLEWLDRFAEAVEGNQVLALPYGDLDVSAATDLDGEEYARARRRSGEELLPWGFPTSPGIGSPSGYLAPDAFGSLRRDGTILVTDQMFRGPAPAVARIAGRTVTVASSSAAAGGPGPNDPYSTIALRQEVLAEAALRALAPAPQPLVVVLPPEWVPDGNPSFFPGLDVPWVDLTSVTGAASAVDEPREVDARDLSYPDRQVVRELDAANFASADRLRRLGRVLEDVLLKNDEVSTSVDDEAMTGLSYSNREFPNAARAAADRSSRWITAQLESIRVQAPPAVTLSSSSGKFSATVVNGLDHPVRVRLESVADAPLQISDTDPLDIPARGRASVLLEATTSRLGVQNVQLLVTTEDGRPLGSTDSLPIRSNQVSDVIWLILGTGVALLFGAIGVRLVRRIRGARA